MRMPIVLALLFAALSSKAQKEWEQPGWEECLKVSAGIPLVMVFFDPECPLSINYTHTVNELAEAYGKNVRWLLVFPGVSSDRKLVDEFCREYRLSLPQNQIRGLL